MPDAVLTGAPIACLEEIASEVEVVGLAVPPVMVVCEAEAVVGAAVVSDGAVVVVDELE